MNIEKTKILKDTETTTSDRSTSELLELASSPCECQNWCREGQKIITKHHPRCSKYSLEDDAKELITDLLRGIEAWSSDEDGVHPESWEAYKRAKAAVWEMHDVHEEGF